jgi:hypothetical protein
MSELQWATLELAHGYVKILQSKQAHDGEIAGLYRHQAYDRITRGLEELADYAEAEAEDKA